MLRSSFSRASRSLLRSTTLPVTLAGVSALSLSSWSGARPVSYAGERAAARPLASAPRRLFSQQAGDAPDAVVKEVTREGSGESPQAGQQVTVHYSGFLEDGTKFDSSVDRGQPFVFQVGVGQVIKGWDVGVLSMKVGEQSRLIIQPEYGYGATGVGPIPGNAVLIFEVELISIA